MTIRLNKVTRDLNVGIATVVEFLQKKGYTVEANPNTKISEEQYAVLVKEFSTDKNLRLESERFIQERQNKERNKASVSIEGFEKQQEKPKSEDVIKTVVPEDARPKFKPVGKIDLDKFSGRRTDKVEKAPEKKVEPVVEQPVVKQPVAEKTVVEKPVVEPEVKKEEPKVEKVEVIAPKPAPVEQPVVAPKLAVETKPVEVEKVVVEEVKKEEPKVVETAPVKAEERKVERTAEVTATVTTPTEENASKENEVFKIRQPELGAKINVIGQIDLAALNQSTRPKKKSKEEKRREREEKEKVRQDQKKLMKEAIIKEIRKEDSKQAKPGVKDNNADAARKKRNRINKEKVDVNNVATSNFAAPRPNTQTGKGGGNHPRPQGQGQGQGNNNNNNKKNNNKDRFKKPVIKQEVSEEDVAKQVKETLARLTTKGKNKTSKYRKEKREMASNRMQELEDQEMAESKVLKLTEFVTANELATMMDVSVNQVIATCMSIGMMVSINQRLDAETINLVAEEFGFKTEYVSAEVAQAIVEEEDAPEDLQPRAPIVTVMGHVDHGKTSLLDYIRKANVIAGEAGGITQHIGAYNVKLEDGRRITFLDTPGHEAFTAMRMRGAQATDIAILVVAADDGVMPQTIEAINHAKAAGVEIIVAVNKIDKPNANIEKVKQELTEYGLIAEDWGGSTTFVPVSAHTKQGIDELLDMILLTAEVNELKANPDRKARGIVIEAELDKGRGPVASILVQKGTLHVGDAVSAGSCYGKIRAMIDDKGNRVKVAGPSTPVEVLGLNDVPNAGEIIMAADSEKEARSTAETFISEGRKKLLDDTKHKVSLDALFEQIQAGNMKELNIIIKADVQGSVEAVKSSLVRLSNDEVVVKVIHGGVGNVNESDVVLASASNAIIIAFNVKPDNQARIVAEREKVDLRLYSVIYNAIEDVEAALKGMLEPIYEEKIIGHARIMQIFKASGVGNIAGCIVEEGRITRDSVVRITRGSEKVYEGPIASLKHFKDEVKEIKAGTECGMVFEKFNDIQPEDMIEAHIMVDVPR